MHSNTTLESILVLHLHLLLPFLSVKSGLHLLQNRQCRVSPSTHSQTHTYISSYQIASYFFLSAAGHLLQIMKWGLQCAGLPSTPSPDNMALYELLLLCQLGVGGGGWEVGGWEGYNTHLESIARALLQIQLILTPHHRDVGGCCSISLPLAFLPPLPSHISPLPLCFFISKPFSHFPSFPASFILFSEAQGVKRQ